MNIYLLGGMKIYDQKQSFQLKNILTFASKL